MPPDEHVFNEVYLPGEIFFPPQAYSGRQFLFDDWKKGDIITQSGKVYTNQLLKYNMLLDELFWLSPGVFNHIMLDRGFINKFTIDIDGGQPLTFQKIPVKNPITGADAMQFAQQLYKGDLELYVTHHKRISARSEVVRTGETVSHQRILQKTQSYYLKNTSGEIVQLRPSRRSFISSMGKDRERINELIMAKQLTIQNQQQLIQAVKEADQYLKSVSVNPDL